MMAIREEGKFEVLFLCLNLLFSTDEMELLQQISEVVEGVIVILSEKLGSDAKEYVCIRELRERADIQLQNSSSVQEAIQHISSSLHWDIKDKLKQRDNRVKNIRDELERSSEEYVVKQNRVKDIRDELESSSKEYIVKQRREDLEQTAECLQQNTSHTVQEEVHDQEPQISSLPESLSLGEASHSFISKTSTSATLDKDHKDGSGDEDDIIILSPVSREPPPVICLTDDSCESISSSITNGPISMPGENAKDYSIPLDTFVDSLSQHQTHKREAEIDLENSKQSLADLHKDERTLNEKINEIQSEEKRHIDTIDSNMLHTSPPLNMENDTGDSHSASSPLSEKVNPQLLNLHSPEAKIDVYENKINQTKTDLENLVSGQPERCHHDALWEDAEFVCSLLPYFTIQDVHQTIVDNLHHPDRRAYVLEAYINLAVDRQEVVSDTVFQGLWAARRQSQGELADSYSENNTKKRKVEVEPEADIKKLRVNEAIPSTSKAGSTFVNVSEPGMPKDMNPGISDIKVIEDPIMEKWYKEKLDIVSEVVHGVDRKYLWAQILSCHSVADVEALVERLMEEQDQIAKHSSVIGPSYEGQDQPSTSAFHPVAVAGPSNILENREESLSGQSTEEGVTGEEDQGTQAADLEDKILAQVKTLTEMFADADPDYLQERYVQFLQV